MSLTCNTLPTQLPTPEEFDRLTANQFQTARDIDADLDAETQCAPDLKKPAAIALAARGLLSKAIAREQCGALATYESCDGSVSPIGQKHVTEIVHTCKQRYCKYDSAARTRRYLKSWYESHPYRRTRKTFLVVSINKVFDCLPTKADLDEFNKIILKHADLAGEGRIPGTGAVWNTGIFKNNDGYTLLAKFAWWGDFDLKAKRKYFPGTKAFPVEIPAAEFDSTLEFLIKPEIPEDPEECALFEELFEGQRAIHCAGGFVRAKNDKPEVEVVTDNTVTAEAATVDTSSLPDITPELFPTGVPEGNNSTPKPPRKCRICGACIVRVSEKAPVGLSPDEIAQLTWYDIQPPG